MSSSISHNFDKLTSSANYTLGSSDKRKSRKWQVAITLEGHKMKPEPKHKNKKQTNSKKTTKIRMLNTWPTHINCILAAGEVNSRKCHKMRGVKISQNSTIIEKLYPHTHTHTPTSCAYRCVCGGKSKKQIKWANTSRKSIVQTHTHTYAQRRLGGEMKERFEKLELS